MASCRPNVTSARRCSGEGHDDVTLYILCDDVDQAYADLREKIRLEPPVDTYYGMRQIFVTDPDGFQICVQTPVKT